MKTPLFWIGILIAGMIFKDSMTKYLLVEVNGSGGTNVPVESFDGLGGSNFSSKPLGKKNFSLNEYSLKGYS